MTEEARDSAAAVDDAVEHSDERGPAILERLRAIRLEADRLTEQQDVLMAERVKLYQEGQALFPRLTQAQMGEASGVTDAAVTLALKAARTRAEAPAVAEGV